MDLDPTMFAVAVPAVLFSAISKGGFGSGAGFVSAPLLALVLEPATAVALMLPLLMLMDVTGLRPYWKQWSREEAGAMMIGAVPGVVAGALFFGTVSAEGLRLAMGLLALGFVAFRLVQSRGLLAMRPMGRGSGVAWGGVCGFTSFVSHAGYPPAAIYLLGNGLSKTAFQATTVVVFWWVNVLKLPGYMSLGLFTQKTMLADLILAPLAVAGVYAGVWAHRHVPERVFFALTYVLLTVTGLKLLSDAL